MLAVYAGFGSAALQHPSMVMSHHSEEGGPAGVILRQYAALHSAYMALHISNQTCPESKRLQSRMSATEERYEGQLIARPEDKVSLPKALLLGLQHVMAMDVYVVPFIIGAALALSHGEAAALIQSIFLAAGLATIIQTALCMKLPVAQVMPFT